LRQALRLVVLTDPSLGRGRSHGEMATQALRGGATTVQLRDHDADDADLVGWAQAIAPAALRAGALLVINDRLDVARLAGAGGCHLGPDDLPLAAARRLWPAPAVIGYSADTPAAAAAALAAGADYLGVGPVYATRSKRDAGPAIGLEGLAAVARATPLPVVAIGGIDAGKVADCIGAGACGVAVLSAVVGAAALAPAARGMRRAVEAALAHRDSP
jgi:thiamine-phosphate pyrophosphorylase